MPWNKLLICYPWVQKQSKKDALHFIHLKFTPMCFIVLFPSFIIYSLLLCFSFLLIVLNSHYYPRFELTIHDESHVADEGVHAGMSILVLGCGYRLNMQIQFICIGVLQGTFVYLSFELPWGRCSVYSPCLTLIQCWASATETLTGQRVDGWTGEEVKRTGLWGIKGLIAVVADINIIFTHTLSDLEKRFSK